jgi:hypothetical protein
MLIKLIKERFDLSERKFIKNFKIKDGYFILLIIIFSVALFSTINSFSPGYIASWDGPAHLVREEHFYNSLNLESLGIFGWYHGWYLGVATFVFYSPGFFVITSLLKLITFGLVQTELLIKVIMALTYALFPVVLCWLLRTLGFSKRISITASILSLGFSAIWGIGLAGIYAIGLYTAVFSLLPFMLFFGFLHKTFENKTNPVIVGLLLGFVVITSIITAIFSFILFSVYIFSLLATRRDIKLDKILKILGICILSSLFWTFPFLNSRELFGVETAFAPFELKELIENLFLGKIIYHPLISVFMILGILFSFWIIYKEKYKSFSYILMLFLLGITIFISANSLTTMTLSWQYSNAILQMLSRIFRSLLRTRALAFLWIIIPSIAAIGVNFTFDVSRKYINKKKIDKIVIIVLLSLLIFSYAQLSDISKTTVKTIEHDDYREKYKEWKLSFEYIKQNAPKNSVILTDINWNRFDSIGTVSIDSLINLESGLRTIKGNQIEATQLNTWYLENSEFKNEQEAKKEFHRYNVDYVLSYRKPEYNVSYLEKVYSSDNIIVYRTVNLVGQYELIEYELKPNRYNLKINIFANGEIELPVQYNNHWYANVNGKNMEVKRDDTGLVKLSLDKGFNDITLIFRRMPSETLAFLISSFTNHFIYFSRSQKSYHCSDYENNLPYFISRSPLKYFVA